MSDPNRQQPLVSVVMVTYERPDYLKQSLASALAQTYGNIEVIVADDCSPTDPRPLIDSFDDPRVRYLRQPRNVGIGTNIRDAFRAARGKYVASLNDDDALEPEFVETLVAPLEADPDLVVAFCDYEIIDSEGHPQAAASDRESRSRRRDRLGEGKIKPLHQVALVDHAMFVACAALIRADAVPMGEIPPAAGPNWDLYASYLISRTGRGGHYTPRRLARYRVHRGSISVNAGSRDALLKVEKGNSLRACYQDFLKDPRLCDHHPVCRLRSARAATTAAIGLLRLGRPKEARPLLHEAMAGWPSPRTAAALALSYLPPRAAAPFLNPFRGVLSRLPAAGAIRHG